MLIITIFINSTNNNFIYRHAYAFRGIITVRETGGEAYEERALCSSKKSSWRADVVMRCPEVIYQEVNKSRLTDRFNKIPGEREREGIYKQF